MAESVETTGTPPSERRRRGRKAWLAVVLLPVAVMFFSVLVGGHWYIAQRLVVDPKLPAGLATALHVMIAALGFSLILHPIAERRFSSGPRRWVAWPASIWMGVAFLLLMALLVSDLLMLLLAAVAPFESSGLLAARVRAVGVIGLVLPAALVALHQGLAAPAVKRVEIPLLRWPAELDGFRIVQISDIHFGSIRGADFAEWLVDQINALSPDVVAITGDLVDGPVSQIRDEVAAFAALRAHHGVYFVTGNHDHYSGAESWAERVAELGVRVLRNDCLTLEVKGASFELAGVDDHRSSRMSGEQGEDLDRALASVDPGRPLILLAHDPTTFVQASRRGVDLQLSGHTHGGQIWPFNFFVKLAVPFVAGLYRRGAATLYVSRGTGFWGPPMRLGSPAEITEIILRADPVAQTSSESPAAELHSSGSRTQKQVPGPSRGST